jgi:hypothetical protein
MVPLPPLQSRQQAKINNQTTNVRTAVSGEFACAYSVMNASLDALFSPVRFGPSTPDSQLSLDLLHEFARASPQLNHDTRLCGSRFFQIGKLTLEQCWIHEMSAPAPELLGNESVLAAKKNQLHLSVHLEISAVCFLQRRTSQNGVLSCGSAPFDQLAQTFQPRPSVLIRQRNASRIFSMLARG